MKLFWAVFFLLIAMLILGGPRQDPNPQCQQELILLRTIIGSKEETIELQSQTIVQLQAQLNALKKDAEKEKKPPDAK